jgi:hypothetical protein
MSYMSLDTKIWRAGSVAGTGHAQISGMYWLDGNAATTCYSGLYEGTAHAYLVPPAGYSPASAVADLESPVVSVSC